MEAAGLPAPPLLPFETGANIAWWWLAGFGMEEDDDEDDAFARRTAEPLSPPLPPLREVIFESTVTGGEHTSATSALNGSALTSGDTCTNKWVLVEVMFEWGEWIREEYNGQAAIIQEGGSKDLSPRSHLEAERAVVVAASHFFHPHPDGARSI